MASKKTKESEGIALLSMYNDEEDEDMEDVNETNDREVVATEEDLQNFDNHFPSNSVQIPTTSTTAYFLSQSQNSIAEEDRVSTPPPQPHISSSLLPQPTRILPPPVERQKRSLAIVDYAHDETVMYPAAEEGEITGTGHVTFGEDLQSSDGNFQGTKPPVTVQILTPTIQGTPPQSLEQPELLQSDNSKSTIRVTMEFETTAIEETVMISVDVDHLDTFLSPPPRTLCSEELQINKFLKLTSAGKSFNAEVRNRKDYQNPDFLLHAVRYQDIDQIGSCFSKDVFDPHGYDKTDFYDELEADMTREMKRKEQERKKSQKLEFVVGGTQAGGVTAAHRNALQNPVAVVPATTSTGFYSHPTPADSFSGDSRQNKKSKWDKVDGDRNNPPLVGGSDALSIAAAHAAILSAANVGAGYNAFA